VGVRIKRALISVSDKTGLEELARALTRHGVEMLSTGGTERALAGWGLSPVPVSRHTGAPEILDGRVKTLHPRVHGGLLGRPTDAHRAEMAEHDIPEIDLVVVNLYPFRETIARPGVSHAEAIENIDIGGPSMLRSAAKNHERVAVVVEPADYPALIAELNANAGAVSRATRMRLARKVFAVTAAYDAAIAAYLHGYDDDGAPLTERALPPLLTLPLERAHVLRYGENPHQRAAFYLEPGPRAGTLGGAAVLQGKELSYNNLLDLDAALEAVREHPEPAVVIVKHTNPCGVACSTESVATAYLAAREADPVSAFGGIVAVNRECDDALARLLAETFLECVIAPAFSAGARDILAKKTQLRLLETGPLPPHAAVGFTYRSVTGGVLVCERDTGMVAAADARVVSKRPPTPDELRALDFAWRVCKHVKSNAIVFAREHVSVGIGAGQMSRVDSAEIAVKKARSPLAGTVVASDAFFPFRDGLDVCARAGATAVIQPGGSKRDDELIAAADEHGMAMVLTGMRHFKH